MKSFQIVFEDAAGFDAELNKVRKVYNTYENLSAAFRITWANDGSALGDVTRLIEKYFRSRSIMAAKRRTT